MGLHGLLHGLSGFYLEGIKMGVYQVDALAKRVAVYWSFWRSDTKALRQDTAVVGDSRAMPEKTAVATFCFCVR